VWLEIRNIPFLFRQLHPVVKLSSYLATPSKSQMNGVKHLLQLRISTRSKPHLLTDSVCQVSSSKVTGKEIRTLMRMSYSTMMLTTSTSLKIWTRKVDRHSEWVNTSIAHRWWGMTPLINHSDWVNCRSHLSLCMDSRTLMMTISMITRTTRGLGNPWHDSSSIEVR
jgi:hypothetical protein